MVFKNLGNTFKVVMLLMTLTISSIASAATIQNIHVFGDSLSDTSTSPFNNGDYWIEYLAPELDIVYDSTNNHAVNGATTTDVYSQVDSYGNANADDLYIIWAGNNDLSYNSPEFVVNDAIANIINSVNLLTDRGANNILVGNLPDLSSTPFTLSTVATYGTVITDGYFNITNDFNSGLANGLGSNATLVDIFSRQQEVYADPAKYGFSNLTEECKDAPVGTDCDTYVFWDQIHPTTASHMWIAEEFYSAASVSAVPVPAAAWLFGSGLIGLAGLARRKKA